jgi:hypothetical protein
LRFATGEKQEAIFLLRMEGKRRLFTGIIDCREKDLNLRRLGYEHNVVMAGPFVS